MKTGSILAVLALGLMAPLAHGGDIHYVSLNGGHSSPFITWPNAATNIIDAVTVATAGDTVLISNGTYNLTSQVTVAAGLIVQGFAGRSNTFISGGGALRCFYMNSTSVLDGLTISNGYGLTGGGAYINNTGYVYNCTFANNVAGQNGGGGLYINQAGLVTNCLFVGNVATSTASGQGGGVYIAAQGVVSNCEFRFNIASNNTGYGGGGVYAPAGANGTVYGSYFYTNTTYSCGGGAYVQYIYNSVFVSNWAALRGGGARVRTFASNCVFTYNISSNTGDGYGGGCSVDIGAALVNCTNISYNTGRYGGGIFFDRSTGAYLHVFGNTAVLRGGGVYLSTGLLSNSVVFSNTAKDYGGGLYCNGNNIQVVDCIISNNSGYAGVTLYGGGIYWSFTAGNTGLLQGCSIVGNTAISSGWGGGLMFDNAYANVPVRRCVIAYNASGYAGGGIYNLSNTGQVENCLIYSNSVTSYGGGVYMGSTNLLVNCTIVSNKATTSGGGIYVAGAGNRVVNSIVYYNANDMLGLGGAGAVSFGNCDLTTTNGLNGEGNITNAPAFVDLDQRNYRLTIRSPCINAGLNQDWMTTATDLDGRPRIDRFSGRVDMGAYEFIFPGTVFTLY